MFHQICQSNSTFIKWVLMDSYSIMLCRSNSLCQLHNIQYLPFIIFGFQMDLKTTRWFKFQIMTSSGCREGNPAGTCGAGWACRFSILWGAGRVPACHMELANNSLRVCNYSQGILLGMSWVNVPATRQDLNPLFFLWPAQELTRCNLSSCDKFLAGGNHQPLTHSCSVQIENLHYITGSMTCVHTVWTVHYIMGGVMLTRHNHTVIQPAPCPKAPQWPHQLPQQLWDHGLSQLLGPTHTTYRVP